MMDLNTINYELFESAYINRDSMKYQQKWNMIKYDHTLLNSALAVMKNRENKTTLCYPTIAEAILINHDDVERQIYDKLINLIFSNAPVARTSISTTDKGCFSFLILALCNQNLKLTESQKEFAVIEALKRIQEIRIQNSPLSKELNIDISKTALVHGTDPYDIRYYILKNSNWSENEKAQLVDMFWTNEHELKEYIEEIEIKILKMLSSNEIRITRDMIQDILYSYNYYDLLEITHDKIFTEELIGEIEFCRKLYEMLELKKLKKGVWWKI